MKNILLLIILLLTFYMLFEVNANATLIGDTVFIGHKYRDVFYSSDTIVVEEGDSDLWTYSTVYNVNIESNKVFVDFIISYMSHFGGNPVPTMPSPSFNGLVISDLDYGAPLIGVNVETNMNWYPSNRLYFGDDFVMFDWERTTIYPEAYFNAELIFAQVPSPVPEPSTIILMGIGLLGLVAIKSRKRKS